MRDDVEYTPDSDDLASEYWDGMDNPYPVDYEDCGVDGDAYSGLRSAGDY